METTSVGSETREMTALWKEVEGFRQRFNESPRVKKLIKKWDRNVMVDAIDTGEQISMIIEDLEMRRIEPGLVESEQVVHLQAEEETFKQMFSGEITPASALMDGALAVFSNERDKVKLEAIAMVIWGV